MLGGDRPAATDEEVEGIWDTERPFGCLSSEEKAMPPLPRCGQMPEDSHFAGNEFRRCHCSKKRKSRMKRMIRVPAIGEKVSDIPLDEYSWRKYGQKPIKGDATKCRTVRGCPARKHVERVMDDPGMLIDTYESDHNGRETPPEPPQ